MAKAWPRPMASFECPPPSFPCAPSALAGVSMVSLPSPRRMIRVTLFAAVLFASSVAQAQGPVTYAGFRQIEFSDAVTGQRVVLLVWYPTSHASRPTRFGPYTLDVAPGAPPAGGRHRLVMISHGTAGDPLSHAQLGMALARQGYVAAAPRHAKDNSRDWSGVGTYEVWYGRPRQISEGIDALLADRTLGTVIDPDRIAVIGHSAGGYDALPIYRRARGHGSSPVTLPATSRR